MARFLKSYSVFITDHTGKEDTFFNLIEEKVASNEENEILRNILVFLYTSVIEKKLATTISPLSLFMCIPAAFSLSEH